MPLTEKSIKGAIFYDIIQTAPEKTEKAYLWRNIYEFLHFRLIKTGAKPDKPERSRGFGLSQAVPDHCYSQAYKIIKEITPEEKEELYKNSVESGCWMDDAYMTGQSDEF